MTLWRCLRTLAQKSRAPVRPSMRHRTSAQEKGRLPDAAAMAGRARPLPEAAQPTREPFFSLSSPMQRRPLLEAVVRRCLREAIGYPSERVVTLATSVAFALVASWLLGRASLVRCRRKPAATP